MDKQKQIDEIARDFGNAQYRCNEDSPCCKECILKGDCIPYEYARVAYNAGYRKERDTAKEILQEIESFKHYAETSGRIADKLGATIAIKTIKEILKSKGVEVK